MGSGYLGCTGSLPLANTLCILAAYFNDLSERCQKLAHAVKDPQLTKWLDNTPESLSSLFNSDASRPLNALQAWYTDGLTSLASWEACSAPMASASATRGQRFRPYSSSTFHHPCHGTSPLCQHVGMPVFQRLQPSSRDCSQSVYHS